MPSSLIGHAGAVTNHHGGSPPPAAHPTDPDPVRARFSWTPPAGADLGGVYLWANRLTDKRHAARGMMHRRPDGSWSLSLDVPRDVMATYRILPLPHGHPALHDGPLPPPRELLRRALIDGTNPAAAAGSPFGSVLVGPGAPGVDAWTARDRAPSEHVDLTGDRPVRCRLAAPRGEGPADLLVVFDADSWFDRLRLPDVLAAAGRRCAVLGIDSPPNPVRGCDSWETMTPCSRRSGTRSCGLDAGAATRGGRSWRARAWAAWQHSRSRPRIQTSSTRFSRTRRRCGGAPAAPRGPPT
ncbi:hypothetical protein MTP03_22700 [Tsukamurella sp. PLM1]|nr:hypothetical protein MTP03_22700 [Tsukamurella sp. PLM1]